MLKLWPAVAFKPSTFKVPTVGKVLILTAENRSAGLSESKKPQSVSVNVIVVVASMEKDLSSPAGGLGGGGVT
jgi:hypothetical protein